MAKLPKSLIKKYGISKKAWNVFRHRHSTSGGKTMPHKRKKGGFMRGAGIGSTGNIFQLDAMAYGAVRQAMSNLIAPLTSKIPLVGNLSDEVGMALVDYLVQRNVGGIIGDVARKGLVIENARVGEALIGGLFNGMISSGTVSATSYYSNNGSY